MISERTALRWMQRTPCQPDRAQSWKTFLANHHEAIAAMDFFTVPTLTFGVLYGFFVIAHDRRRILHLDATQPPDKRMGVAAAAQYLPLRLRSEVLDL